jgi:hypothetical protein
MQASSLQESSALRFRKQESAGHLNHFGESTNMKKEPESGQYLRLEDFSDSVTTLVYICRNVTYVEVSLNLQNDHFDISES